MDSQDGGQYSGDPQRKTAAEIARRKVLAAYAESAEKSSRDAAKTESASEPSHLKQTTYRINAEDWKKYHSAWQNYYRKYYNNYYSKAAWAYIEKEKQHQKTEAKTEEKTENKSDDKLRQAIQAKASDKAQISRRLRRYAPLIAGVAVMLLILFLQYNRLIFAPIMAYVSPGNAPASEIEAVDPTLTQSVSAEPRLIIPKLNIDVPVHYGLQLSEVMSAMNSGVAHYRIAGASAYPGEIGNFVITGHSAGDIYSSNPYKYIFSGLERLDNDDLIYVNYQSKRYIYSVTKKDIIEPTNVAALTTPTDKPILTLVTCTPVGTSRYRLLVTAEQISPSTDSATMAETIPESDQAEESLPANEPSFFEGIWNWLTGQ